MGYTTSNSTKIGKHFFVSMGSSVASSVLLGLSCLLPLPLALPLCVVFLTTGVGSLISAGMLIIQWFDQTY